MQKPKQLLSNNDTEFVIIGKIGAVYGVQGWLKVISFTDATDTLLGYDPWYIEDNKTWRPLKRNDAQMHGKGIIAKMIGYDTPETARLLTGKKIAIKREQLAVLKKNEYYWTELEGLTVINQKGEVLGKIVYLIETGSNDVLVVKNATKEIAIPYLPGEVVINIDLAKQVMLVNWDWV